RSRLAAAAGEDEDIQQVVATTYPGARATMFVCQVKLRTGTHPERSAGAVLERLASARRMPPSGLRILSLAASMSLAAQSEDVAARAQSLALFLHFTGDPLLYSRSFQHIFTLRPHDVSAFAEQYLRSERARVLILTPAGGSSPAVSAPEPD